MITNPAVFLPNISSYHNRTLDGIKTDFDRTLYRIDRRNTAQSPQKVRSKSKGIIDQRRSV